MKGCDSIATTHSMFSRSLLCRRISSFSLFLKDLKGTPSLAGLGGPERAKKASEIFKTLSSEDRAVLARRASRLSFARFQRGKGARKAPPFGRFVKEKYETVSGSPSERMQQISALWKEKKAGGQPS